MAHTRRIVATWRIEDTTERMHGSLGNLTPRSSPKLLLAKERRTVVRVSGRLGHTILLKT
jgi:hypothetical protein